MRSGFADVRKRPKNRTFSLRENPNTQNTKLTQP